MKIAHTNMRFTDSENSFGSNGSLGSSFIDFNYVKAVKVDVRSTQLPVRFFISDSSDSSEVYYSCDSGTDSDSSFENYKMFKEKIRNNVTSKFRLQHLVKACSKGYLDVVETIMKDVELCACKANFIFPALEVACLHNHLAIVKYFMEKYRSTAFSPLVYACQKSSLPVSMYLLHQFSDLDVNIADCSSNTPMHYTIWCSKVNRTPLHNACDERDIKEVLRLVYLSGHAVNIQDNFGNTPLHLACKQGYSDILITLMIAGIDETITNEKNQTAADVAWKYKHYDLVKFLCRDTIWEESNAEKSSLADMKSSSVSLARNDIYYVCNNFIIIINSALKLFRRKQCYIKSRTESILIKFSFIMTSTKFSVLIATIIGIIGDIQTLF